MRDYELVLILNPEIGEEETKNTLKSVEQLITSLKGKLKRTDEWGKRDLAYPIKKLNQGHYFLLVLTLSSDAPAKLEEKLKLEDRIIRFLIVSVRK